MFNFLKYVIHINLLLIGLSYPMCRSFKEIHVLLLQTGKGESFNRGPTGFCLSLNSCL